MPVIQRLLVIASATVLFFLLLCLCRAGKRAACASPCSQREVQQEAFRPFPKFITVAALKSAQSSSLIGSCIPFHGFSLLSHSNHSHLSLGARLKQSRSLMPRPPLGWGMQTLGQATLHLPPVSSPSPAHRNLFLSLYISFKNLFGALTTVSR